MISARFFFPIMYENQLKTKAEKFLPNTTPNFSDITEEKYQVYGKNGKTREKRPKP